MVVCLTSWCDGFRFQLQPYRDPLELVSLSQVLLHGLAVSDSQSVNIHFFSRPALNSKLGKANFAFEHYWVWKTVIELERESLCIIWWRDTLQMDRLSLSALFDRNRCLMSLVLDVLLGVLVCVLCSAVLAQEIYHDISLVLFAFVVAGAQVRDSYCQFDRTLI